MRRGQSVLPAVAQSVKAEMPHTTAHSLKIELERSARNASGDMPAAREGAHRNQRVCRARLTIIPDRDCTIVVTPEYVVMAVVVEVADAGYVIGRRN